MESPRLTLHKAGYWAAPGTQLKESLKLAFQDFRRWKKANRVSCSQPNFQKSWMLDCTLGDFDFFDCGVPPAIQKKSFLKLQPAWTIRFWFHFAQAHTPAWSAKVYHCGEPWMTCKAFNGRCVAAWLADRAVSLLERDPTNVEHQLVAGCLNHECNRVGVPVNRNFANMSGPFCLQGPGAIISYVQWSKQEDICRALRTRFPCLPQPTGLESIPLGTCHLPNGFGMFVKTIRSQEEATNILLHGLRYLNLYKALTRL